MNSGFTQVVEKLLDLEITTVWASYVPVNEPLSQSVNKQLFIVKNIVKLPVKITY
jgi:hypothetical protein